MIALAANKFLHEIESWICCLTFDLMKNAAIRRSNHYCNFRSDEKWKKSSYQENFRFPVSISWNSTSWPPVTKSIQSLNGELPITDTDFKDFILALNKILFFVRQSTKVPSHSLEKQTASFLTVLNYSWNEIVSTRVLTTVNNKIRQQKYELKTDLKMKT